MGCRANRVTVTREAAQLLCRLHPCRIWISPVLTLPPRSSRVRATVAPVRRSCSTEGRISVNGVASSTLRVALTTTTGAGMKPKPFAAHLQTFYTFRSNQCGAVLHQRLFRERGKAVSHSPPPNHFLLPFVRCRHNFFPFASGRCQCACTAPSPQITAAIFVSHMDRCGLFTQENATSCHARRKFENTKLQPLRQSRCVIFQLASGLICIIRFSQLLNGSDLQCH